MHRTVRYLTPLSLFMLDIDFFKAINDSHGHKAGDAVLKKLAEICLRTLREVDVIGRLGGEEFAILLPETSQEEAIDVAERLRLNMSEAYVAMENGLLIQFTVSIGVTSYAAKDENLDALLHKADTALYQAKRSGRNKVCTA